MKKVKILIVDDHPLIQQGIKALLADEGKFDISTEVNNAEDALQKLAVEHFDLVIMDIKMPGMGGVQATREITSKHPGVKILASSMLEDKHYIEEMLKAGAQGYVLKNATSREMLNAINTIMGGQTYFSQGVSSIMMSQFMKGKPDGNDDAAGGLKDLTKRELEIIKMIASEMTNSQIAKKLNISPRTIDTHRRNILRKIEVKNTAGLVKYAIQHQLL